MTEAVRMALVLRRIVERCTLLEETPRFSQSAQGKQGTAHGSPGFQQPVGLLSRLGDGEHLFRKRQSRLHIARHTVVA